MGIKLLTPVFAQESREIITQDGVKTHIVAEQKHGTAINDGVKKSPAMLAATQTGGAPAVKLI